MQSRPRSHDATPLARPEAHDVLRYWLAAIRLEEALAARPRAQRTRHAQGALRLDEPLSGQEYFKQPLDGPLAELLFARATLQRPLDGELSAFFEGWLHTQYRRPTDDAEQSHLLCFPVLHLARGELAGLLRAPVSVRFTTAAGGVFRVPTRRERALGAYPEAPSGVQLAPQARREQGLPFFVDTRLLHNTLGLSSDSIDALFAALREREELSEQEMLRLVTQALHAELGETSASAVDTKEGALSALTAVVKRLLRKHGSRAEAYGVAIVLDGAQAKTTWHLQRELTALIEEEELRLDSPLGCYLTRRPLPEGRALQRAQFFGAPLTDSQRSAAECFWGSAFSSVQGPPGTGKTTLILHLCAEALVRRVEGLVTGSAPSDELLVIVSSNNRAVDNVLEPLATGLGDAQDGFSLPLGLRAGSRQVVGELLVGTLRHSLSWLVRAENTPSVQRATRLAEAVTQLSDCRAALDELLAPRARAFARAHELAQLEQELRMLPPALASEPDDLITRLPPALAEPLSGACRSLDTRLSILSRLCEAPAGPSALRAVARQFARMLKRDIPSFEAAVLSAGLDQKLSLPPAITPELDAEALLEAWEEATERSLAVVTDLRARLKAHSQAAAGRRARERIAQRLEALRGDEVSVASPALGELPLTLFRAALQLREAWAASQASELRCAVECALRTAENERSLRGFFRDEPSHAKLLRQLFPVWGSTLLSLGNCFPAEPRSLARVIIDEAGQCHPAHAVSALLRAESALILGDVHQLTPVFELSIDDDERILSSARLRIAPERLEPYRVHQKAHTSTQALAEAAAQQRHGLVDHFRCQPEIIELSNALCGYGLNVHTLPMSRSAEADFLRHAVSLVDVKGAQEPRAGSYCNRAELELVVSLLRALLRRGIAPLDLAVITPYRGQLELLRSSFREHGFPVERSPELSESEALGPRGEPGIALGTVHRFQGGERSIVLLSSVVTEARSLPFLDARPNLLNVAISRARHHFVCLGDRDVLRRGARTGLLDAAARPLLPDSFLMG